MSVGKRVEILEAIESQRAIKLEESAEIPYMTLRGIKEGRSNPSFDTLIKLLNVFPSINARWLILGEEPMFMPYLGTELGGYAVHEPAVEYMKRSTLYNFPLLVEEVEELRKILAELRKSVAEMQAELKTLRDNSKDNK
jgi:hypothetical protein